MRLAIIDDEGVAHDIEDNLDNVDWYDPHIVQELMEEVRHLAVTLSEEHDNGDE